MSEKNDEIGERVVAAAKTLEASMQEFTRDIGAAATLRARCLAEAEVLERAYLELAEPDRARLDEALTAAGALAIPDVLVEVRKA